MPIDSTGSTVGYASTAEIAIYDCDNGDRTEDVAFWRGLAHDYGRDQGVIEFGCGTLRLALPIATDGIAVTALDLSLIHISFEQMAHRFATWASQSFPHGLSDGGMFSHVTAL